MKNQYNLSNQLYEKYCKDMLHGLCFLIALCSPINGSIAAIVKMDKKMGSSSLICWPHFLKETIDIVGPKLVKTLACLLMDEN